MQELYALDDSDAMYIPNERLCASKMPGPDAAWNEIKRFALTFDGYKRWGFDQCATIANERRHSTLTELRTCLFFEQRRWRHVGGTPDDESLQYIRGVLEQIRARVQAGNELLA